GGLREQLLDVAIRCRVRRRRGCRAGRRRRRRGRGGGLRRGRRRRLLAGTPQLGQVALERRRIAAELDDAFAADLDRLAAEDALARRGLGAQLARAAEQLGGRRRALRRRRLGQRGRERLEVLRREVALHDLACASLLAAHAPRLGALPERVDRELLLAQVGEHAGQDLVRLRTRRVGLDELLPGRVRAARPAALEPDRGEPLEVLDALGLQRDH